MAKYECNSPVTTECWENTMASKEKGGQETETLSYYNT